jgi:hypothetical protein
MAEGVATWLSEHYDTAEVSPPEQQGMVTVRAFNEGDTQHRASVLLRNDGTEVGRYDPEGVLPRPLEDVLR